MLTPSSLLAPPPAFSSALLVLATEARRGCRRSGAHAPPTHQSALFGASEGGDAHPVVRPPFLRLSARAGCAHAKLRSLTSAPRLPRPSQQEVTHV